MKQHLYPTDPVQFYLGRRNQRVSIFDMAQASSPEDLTLYIAGYMMHAHAYTEEEAFRLVGKDQGMLALLALAEELGIGEGPDAALG